MTSCPLPHLGGLRSRIPHPGRHLRDRFANCRVIGVWYDHLAVCEEGQHVICFLVFVGYQRTGLLFTMEVSLGETASKTVKAMTEHKASLLPFHSLVYIDKASSRLEIPLILLLMQ